MILFTSYVYILLVNTIFSVLFNLYKVCIAVYFFLSKYSQTNIQNHHRIYLLQTIIIEYVREIKCVDSFNCIVCKWLLCVSKYHFIGKSHLWPREQQLKPMLYTEVIAYFTTVNILSCGIILMLYRSLFLSLTCSPLEL